MNGHPTLATGYTHISHRGAAGLAPENTFPAFDLAVRDAGTDVLELDVHATRDGAVVVIHDATVDRTCNGHGPVNGYSWDALRHLHAGYHFSPDDGRTVPFRSQEVRIPLLSEVLERYPDRKFNIDVKQMAPPIEDRVIGILRECRKESQVVLGSGRHVISQRLKRLAPDLPSFCSRRDVIGFFLRCRAGLPLPCCPHQAIQTVPATRWFAVVTPRLVDAAHRCGLYVHVWTVNEEPEMERLLRLGVDGIITDFPHRLTAVLGRLRA